MCGNVAEIRWFTLRVRFQIVSFIYNRPLKILKRRRRTQIDKEEQNCFKNVSDAPTPQRRNTAQSCRRALSMMSRSHDVLDLRAALAKYTTALSPESCPGEFSSNVRHALSVCAELLPIEEWHGDYFEAHGFQ